MVLVPQFRCTITLILTKLLFTLRHKNKENLLFSWVTEEKNAHSSMRIHTHVYVCVCMSGK